LEILQDILAALASVADPITEGFVALTLGFAIVPTGIGFLIGAAFMLIFNSVVPVSFQVEGLAVVSRLSKGDWKTMCYAVMLSGIVGAILGAVGVFDSIVSFIGTGIQGGLLVGAGLILAIISIEIFKENWKIGAISVLAAYVVFLVWGDLLWALVASVGLSIIAARWIPAEPIGSNPEIEKVRFLPRSFHDLKYFMSRNVIIAALGILALRCGTSIAYGGVDAMLSGTTMNPDHVNITSGIASIFSGMFGGANLEPIIAGHVTAPHPVYAGALMLAIMGVLCLTGVIPWMTKWVPTQAVCGFLMTISLLIVIPENASFMLEDPVAGAVTAGITAATINPFAGMVVGIIVRAIMVAAGT